MAAVDWSLAEKVAVRAAGREPFADSYHYESLARDFEELTAIAEKAHSCGGKLLVSAYPMALGMLKSPGELGADVVCAPGELDRAVRSTSSSFVLDTGQLTHGIDAVVDCVGSEQSLSQAIRRLTGSFAVGDGSIDRLTGGADVVVDCVGSEQSLSQAIRVVAPSGTVHMVGMPGVTTLDLTPVWQREVALRGVYAYDADDDRGHDFATAIELIRDLDLGRLVSATYPLSRYEDAIDHAAHAGVRGAVKIAFDLRSEKERETI